MKKIMLSVAVVFSVLQAGAQVQPKPVTSAKAYIKQQEEKDPNLQPKKQPIKFTAQKQSNFDKVSAKKKGKRSVRTKK